jgi:hypothetical protein
MIHDLKYTSRQAHGAPINRKRERAIRDPEKLIYNLMIIIYKELLFV